MSLDQIFDLITKYGPMSIFAVLWFLERGERIDAQMELKSIAKDSIVAITRIDNAFNQIISVLRPPSHP